MYVHHLCVYVELTVEGYSEPSRYSRRETEPLRQGLVPRQVARSDLGSSLASRREPSSTRSRKMVGFGRFGPNFDRLWACMDPAAHRAMADGSFTESL